MGKYSDSIDTITKARLRLSAVGSVISIALAMFFIGFLVFILYFSSKLITNISENIEMEILFYSNVNEADIMAYEQKMKLEPFTANCRISSKEDNTAEAIKAVGNDFKEIITNPINASILFSLHTKYNHPDSVKAIIAKINQQTIVQDIVYPDTILKFVQDNLFSIHLTIFIAGFIFILISMLLIANSIRLNIYSKRMNIRSMLLVGATRSFVRKPFIWKGFVQGVWGGGIAVILLGVVLYFGEKFMPNFVSFADIQHLALLGVSIFIFSIIFTIIIALFSVNKYIKVNQDRLYL